MNKIKIEDLNEYNGSWCKKNKDGFCDIFTMVDLKELLAQQKEEIMGEINKEYKKAEKMEGYDVKQSIVVMDVLNKIKEKL